MSSDVASFYKHLRASTVALLGYDADKQLSPAEQIRVDRAIALRLVIDDAQGKQMRGGETIDIKAFVEASVALERMVPGGNPEAPSGAHDFSGAREELSRLLDGRLDALERRMAMDPNKARAEFEERLALAIAKHPEVAGVDRHQTPLTNNENLQHCGAAAASYNEKPASGDARYGVVPLPTPVEQPAAAAGGTPVLISPAPPPPPPSPASAAERHANVERLNAQPANPAPEPLPEWRRWVDENGVRTSPWSGGRY